jgi:hypothetical protein
MLEKGGRFGVHAARAGGLAMIAAGVLLAARG